MSEINRDGDKITIKPDRDLVFKIINEIKADLCSLTQESPKEIIVDLTGVEIIDSVGIGILVATHNTLTRAGGKLKVTNVIPDIYTLLKQMRLHQHFEIERPQ